MHEQHSTLRVDDREQEGFGEAFVMQYKEDDSESRADEHAHYMPSFLSDYSPNGYVDSQESACR